MKGRSRSRTSRQGGGGTSDDLKGGRFSLVRGDLRGTGIEREKKDEFQCTPKIHTNFNVDKRKMTYLSRNSRP